MYLPAYEERVKDDSMGDQKIYLPIDIRAVAQRLECSEHLLFGQIYYHLDFKHRYAQDNGAKVHLFSMKVGNERHVINMPYLVAILAGLNSEHGKTWWSIRIAIGAACISFASLIATILKSDQHAVPMSIVSSAATSAAHAASVPASQPSMVASAVTAAASHAASATLPVAHAAASAWAITNDAIANSGATIFGSLAGAFVGALGAYYFQLGIAKKHERRAAEMAAHRTMFSLLQQMNTLVLIQRDFVHAHAENPARFLAIPGTMPFDPERDALDLSTLSYLLDKGEGRHVLYGFYMAQENYREVLRTWNDRSLMHRNEAQPKLAAAGFEGEAEVTLADLKRILGAQLVGSLINSTENCIRLLKDSFQLLAKSKIELRAYLVKRFGHGDFTDFEIDENFGLDQPYVQRDLINTPNPT